MGKRVRLIAAGSYDTRGTDVAANLSRDKRLINFYMTADPSTGRRRLEKRPGWTSGGVQSGTTATWPYGTSLVLNNKYGGVGYLLANANVFSGASAIDVVYGTTSLGQISPATNSFKQFTTQAETTSAQYHLLSINRGSTFSTQAGEGWFYQVTSATAAGALTQITDVDFPTDLVGPLTQKWGYVFGMTQGGNVVNSDENSITAYTAGSYFSCNAVPGVGVGVWDAGGDLLAAFKAESCELLYNAGVGTLSPLRRANGGVIDIGLVQASAICYADQYIAFVGRLPQTNALGVYLLLGQTVSKISTPVIDQWLQSYSATFGRLHASAITVGGDTVLLLSISADSGTTFATMACRLSDKFWFEWAYSTTPVLPIGVIGSGTGGSFCISGANNSRKRYELDYVTPAYQDDGNSYTGTIQLTGIDMGSDNNKTMNSLTVIGDTPSASDALSVELSDDDGSSWASVGTIDMSTDHRRIAGLGAFRKRGIRLSHASATSCRIEAVDVDVSMHGS